MSRFDEITVEVEDIGLVVLGTLETVEIAADLPPGMPTDSGTVLLAGNAGPDMWRHFQPRHAKSGITLDDWIRREVSGIASATALFPADGPPWLPFQRWGEKTGRIHTSPIQVQIHETWGLWFAYRAALIVERAPQNREAESRGRPCESCEGRPCLSACPVDAFADERYDVPACISHISADTGADCLGLGCAARRACPVGREFTYEAEQAAFHMKAFLGANRNA